MRDSSVNMFPLDTHFKDAMNITFASKYETIRLAFLEHVIKEAGQKLRGVVYYVH